MGRFQNQPCVYTCGDQHKKLKSCETWRETINVKGCAGSASLISVAVEIELCGGARRVMIECACTKAVVMSVYLSLSSTVRSVWCEKGDWLSGAADHLLYECF